MHTCIHIYVCMRGLAPPIQHISYNLCIYVYIYMNAWEGLPHLSITSACPGFVSDDLLIDGELLPVFFTESSAAARMRASDTCRICFYKYIIINIELLVRQRHVCVPQIHVEYVLLNIYNYKYRIISSAALRYMWNMCY